MKKNYNVNELQLKNKDIIAQNQEETSELLLGNIPAKTLEKAGVGEQKGAEEEESEEEEIKEEQDQFHVEVVQNFF